MSHNLLKMKRLIKINKIIPKFIKIIPNSYHIVINERKSVKAYMFPSCHMIYIQLSIHKTKGNKCSFLTR